MIIAVASGKGGTGKTIVAVSPALSLSNVQVLDCDVENGFLRWAFIRSARAAVHSSTPNRFQRIYQKIKVRRGEKGAIMATARHMAESV